MSAIGVSPGRRPSPVALRFTILALALGAAGRPGFAGYPGAGGSELPVLTAAREAVEGGQTARTRTFGNTHGAGEFEELPADGEVLIGFDFGVGKFMNSDVVYTVRPFFMTPGGQ